jgi:cytochrome c-type biogenesis protein CcmH/NrfG
VEHYEAAVKLDPTLVEAWIGGAQVLISLKRITEASDWLARAKRLYPDRAEFAQLQDGLKQ